MKYKILTKEQIIISLDRLTRFKNTKEKYLRVFSDILVASLIEPKFKKSDIESMDLALVTKYVSEIINASIYEYIDIKNIETDVSLKQNKHIQEFLKDYENSVFINDIDTQKLLNNTINYYEAAHLVEKEFAINLKWLTYICKNSSKISTEEKCFKFPIKEVVLVEGITEEILLPAFSKYLGYDFNTKGIQIIAAGGKNQVVKMYYKLANELKIPIFVLLDKDAEENINQIKPKLRKEDRIHLVSCGEFEDLLPKSLIVKTVNSHFKNFLAINETDLESNEPRAKILEEIFKTKGLHEFKKAEFAKLVKENINSIEDISAEIVAIIEEMSLTNKVLDTEICS